jgi:small subunit ribosomal protein S4
MLNGRKTDVPSAATKAGDIIGWTATSKKNEYYKFAQANMANKSCPEWLNVDTAQMTGRIVSAPAIAQTPGKFDPAVIVEYYSR